MRAFNELCILVNTNKHNGMNSLLYNCYLHFTDTECFKFMYTLWKARILTEVEETGESGKTTNLRWATTTLPHPLIRENETWTVLKILDRVYGQGYGRIGSD